MKVYKERISSSEWRLTAERIDGSPCIYHVKRVAQGDYVVENEDNRVRRYRSLDWAIKAAARGWCDTVNNGW